MFDCWLASGLVGVVSSSDYRFHWLVLEYNPLVCCLLRACCGSRFSEKGPGQRGGRGRGRGAWLGRQIDWYTHYSSRLSCWSDLHLVIVAVYSLVCGDCQPNDITPTSRALMLIVTAMERAG